MTLSPHVQDLRAALTEDVATPPVADADDPIRPTTVYLPVDLHRHLRLAALQRDVSLSALMRDLVTAWLEAPGAIPPRAALPEAPRGRRTTIHLPVSLHRRGRRAALAHDASMTAVLRHLATVWLAANPPL